MDERDPRRSHKRPTIAASVLLLAAAGFSFLPWWRIAGDTGFEALGPFLPTRNWPIPGHHVAGGVLLPMLVLALAALVLAAVVRPWSGTPRGPLALATCILLAAISLIGVHILQTRPRMLPVRPSPALYGACATLVLSFFFCAIAYRRAALLDDARRRTSDLFD